MLGRTADALIRRFGWRHGLRLLAQLRRAKYARAGRIVRADVPSLAAPVYLRARTSDTLVLKQVVLDEHFAFGMPSEPEWIVDAGANIGLASAALATRFPRARIIALELDAGNYQMLRRNVAAYENVTPVHAGLWSRSADLAVFNPDAYEWAYQAREAPSGGAVTTPGYSLTDVLQRFGLSRVDLLKVDIEGGEIEVFGDTADQWIDRVGVIAIELHDHLVPGCEAAVLRRLGPGYTRSRAGEYHVFARQNRS